MNLVQDPWLPFKYRDGTVQVMPVSAIADPNVVDFALPRDDFQGAAYQFTIGLLQTVLAPEDKGDWQELFLEAPTNSKLQLALDSVEHAFNCTGPGPLFMQDYDPLDQCECTTVSALLIEAPGENGVKKNTDHFIKRGIGSTMSVAMANMALFTLLINAPSGGAGNRTGLRGGGPLTTLILPNDLEAPLWQKLWLNVINRDFWRYDDPDLHSGSVFPWLASTKTSDKAGTEIFAPDVHPLHMYWAMPRRVRLILDTGNTECQISGEQVAQSVSVYRAKNYGGNYKGQWQHPLTPYKGDPKKPDEDSLPLKGQPGGITYKTWNVLLYSSSEGSQRCAKNIQHYYELCSGFPVMQAEFPRLWAFAYDMDNMKARGWYSNLMPLFSIEAKYQNTVLVRVKALQQLAGDALWQCRTQIKSAWFERPGDTKGDFSFIDLAFWQRSETAFFVAVEQLIANEHEPAFLLTPEQAKTWLKAVRDLATDLFDEYALAELGTERSMAKKIKSRQVLTKWLMTGKTVKDFIQEHNINKLEVAV